MHDDDLETFRHQCEVRWLLKRYGAEGKEAVSAWLDDVARQRGQEWAERIRADALHQWRMGNRGHEKGEWRA